MEIINKGLLVNNINPQYNVSQNNRTTTQTTNQTQGNSFESILSGKIDESSSLKFSKHANLRLFDRNLNLTQGQMERVQEGVNQARTKGVTDSLVLVDDVALVVSVKNNTVITATNKNNTSVFTNINGAVIV
ncbi:MAG: TIGR02530 family flagellar biosynthesis protein [Coprobacillaceae bacterium]